MDEKQPTRLLSPDELVVWADNPGGVMRLRTELDVIPGGYMAALAPAFVAWRDSVLGGDEPFVIIRNVNYGGNPLERTTILHSVKLPLRSVDYAELTLVPSTILGPRFAIQHLQLRFVLKEGRALELLQLGGPGMGSDIRIEDLVLSWESWRPPEVKFSLKQGLDELAYGLSMRAFAGPQRFLEDSLRGHDWYNYRLRLPGGEAGANELLEICLAMGDGVARHTVTRLLEHGYAHWLEHAPPGATDQAQAEAAWRILEQRARPIDTGADAPPGLAEDQQTYHALVRSCAAFARYTILLAARRMVDKGYGDISLASAFPEPALGTPEPWMAEAATADWIGLFLRAPTALRYLIRHREAVPSHIPDELEEAGLLERRGGSRWELRYGRDHLRPYNARGVDRMP